MNHLRQANIGYCKEQIAWFSALKDPSARTKKTIRHYEELLAKFMKEADKERGL